MTAHWWHLLHLLQKKREGVDHHVPPSLTTRRQGTNQGAPTKERAPSTKEHQAPRRSTKEEDTRQNNRREGQGTPMTTLACNKLVMYVMAEGKARV